MLYWLAAGGSHTYMSYNRILIGMHARCNENYSHLLLKSSRMPPAACSLQPTKPTHPGRPSIHSALHDKTRVQAHHVRCVLREGSCANAFIMSSKLIVFNTSDSAARTVREENQSSTIGVRRRFLMMRTRLRTFSAELLVTASDARILYRCLSAAQ